MSDLSCSAVSTLSLPGNIKLHPADWFLAPWRNCAPLSVEAPRAFDKARALDELKGMPERIDQWSSRWCLNRTPDFWSKEEAQFWLHALVAMFQAQREVLNNKQARKLAEQLLLDNEPQLNDLTSSATANLGDYAVIPLIKLHDWQALTVLCEEPNFTPPSFTLAFRKFVLPYLEAEQKEILKSEVTARLPGRNHWPSSSYRFSALTLMSAALGMEEIVAPIVYSWQDDIFKSSWDFAFLQGALSLLWGLKAEDVRSQFDRLQLMLFTREDMLAWIAHNEGSVLDPLRKCVTASRGKLEVEEKIATLSCIESAAVAPHMVELYLTSKAPSAARIWMDAFPQYTLQAALEIARTKPELKDRALILADNISGPQGAPVTGRGIVQLSNSADSTSATAEAPVWLAEQFAMIRPSSRSKRPSWLTLGRLQPVTIEEYKLSDDQLDTLLSELRSSTGNDIKPMIKVIREKTVEGTFDWFLRDLFEKWLEAGANPKDKWMMLSFGLLGSDELVSGLIPLMIEWRKTGLHQRAFLGLECMRLRGSDAALQRINDIAQSDELRSLRTKASEYIDRIAEDRKLTRAQLEDRIVPHCGFLRGQTRILNFGSRQFQLILSKELKPSLIESDGKPRANLPEPNSKDDTDLVEKAKAEWKSTKKDLLFFVKVQSSRMERAMIDRREWSMSEFQQFITGHPLLILIARNLLWCARESTAGPGGHPKAVEYFRLTEEDGLADSDDRVLQLAADATISVAHPYSMEEQERIKWIAVLADYDLIPPFPQLTRSIKRLNELEASGDQLFEFIGRKVEAVALPTFLEKQGWSRGAIIDGGYFFNHLRFFSGANLTAIIEYSGIFAGAPHESEDQKIEHCYFVHGHRKQQNQPESRDAVPLKEVDPIALSEVLCDLTTLTTRYAREL